jgi:general secretion pathway protein H
MAGFTLLELVVALLIASLVVGVGAPAAYRFYQTAGYRDAVRTVQSAAGTARYRAVASGKSWDLLIDTERKAVIAAPGETELDRDGAGFRALGDDLELEATTAREYARSGLSAIRFFPSGGSSGGSVRIAMPGRAIAQIDVDWLTGRVVQSRQRADG